MTVETIGLGLGRAVTRFRWTTIIACLFSFVALGWGMARVSFSTDYKIFFADDDPHKQAFSELEDVFAKTDNIVFVVVPRQGDVFTASVLGAVQDLTTAGWKLPFVTRVDSLTNYQYSYAEGDDIIVEDLVFDEAQALAPADFAEIRRRATGDPLLQGGLLATDHGAAGVNLTLRLPRQDSTEVTDAATAARQLAAMVASEHPDVEIRVSGMALMNEAFMQASIQDMSRIIPIMIAVMVAVLVVLLRSAWATACIVLIVGLSSGVTLGVAGWLGYALTPPTASAPTVVLTLAIADGVHIFKSTQTYVQAGHTRVEAIVRAIGVNLRPVVLTSVTTMIGFLGLNFAEAPPYWHLANMTAAGVFAALVYSVTLLPALLSLRPVPAPRASRQTAMLAGLGDWVTRRRRAILLGTAVMTVLGGWAASRLESNDQFVKYFDRSIAFRPDTEFMMEHLTGIYTVEYRVGAGGRGQVSAPQYLRDLDAFTTWLRAQPEVTHVYSYADIIKRVNRNLHNDDPQAYAIPASQEAASQELMLFEMSLPMGLDLNDRVDIDRASSRVSLSLRDIASADMLAFKARSEAWLRDNTPPFMHAQATSPVIIFTILSHDNTRSMMLGNVVSLGLISVCLVLALGSVRLGLLSVIPNLLPIVFGYGLWSVLFGEINIVASIGGTVCLGIIVDDTIHFLSKYQLARRDLGVSPAQAVRRTVSAVGPAMIATTLVLVLGFGVLTQSGFAMNSVLGLLVVLVVMFALATDLLVLPALLLLADRRGPTPDCTPTELADP